MTFLGNPFLVVDSELSELFCVDTVVMEVMNLQNDAQLKSQLHSHFLGFGRAGQFRHVCLNLPFLT